MSPRPPSTPPSSQTAQRVLKRRGGVDVFDRGADFTPFKTGV